MCDSDQQTKSEGAAVAKNAPIVIQVHQHIEHSCPDTGSLPLVAAPPEWAVRVLFDAWREANESIRDSARLRWEVAKTFLTAMAAIITATVLFSAKIGKAPVALSWFMAALTLAAFLPHYLWQRRYARFVDRAIAKSNDLAEKIDALIVSAGSGFDSCSIRRDKTGVLVFSTEDAQHGTNAIYRVCFLMNFAAASLLVGLLGLRCD